MSTAKARSIDDPQRTEVLLRVLNHTELAQLVAELRDIPYRGEQYLRDAALCRYGGFSEMTLWRWRKEIPDFPPQYDVNGYQMTNVPEFNAWVKRRVADQTKKKHRGVAGRRSTEKPA